MAAFSGTGTPTHGSPRRFCTESRGAPPMCDVSSPVQDSSRGDVDFGGLFKARRQFPFLVAGSDEDPFEHPQVDVAQERLGLQMSSCLAVCRLSSQRTCGWNASD